VAKAGHTSLRGGVLKARTGRLEDLKDEG
jgi:hypothetical protein